MEASNVTTFDLDEFTALLRVAAVGPDAAQSVKSIVQKAVSEPTAMIEGIPEYKENDILLFEDDTVSIWHTRFVNGAEIPPHDHQMSVVIGVYRGIERNDFYENDPTNLNGGIRKSGEITLSTGDVASIGPSAIHTVSCTSKEPCCGIHVYLGKLSTVERSLFDVESGEKLAYTDENYNRLSQSPVH